MRVAYIALATTKRGIGRALYVTLDFILRTPVTFYLFNKFEDFLYIKDKLPLNYYILSFLIFLIYLL